MDNKKYSLVCRTGYLSSKVIHRAETREECERYLNTMIKAAAPMGPLDIERYSILPLRIGDLLEFGEGTYGR